jgi:hypothetical protein
METTFGKEQIFRLLPKLNLDQARERAWDKKTSVFGSGLTGFFSRPKPEEVQITYSEYRYEPFWHVACNVHYEYDRTRGYNVPVSAPEVQRVTIDGKDYSITAKPRQFTIKGTEHCIEVASTEVIFDAVRLQEQDWKKYLRMDKEPVSDLSELSIDESIVVTPEMRASAVVRKVLASLLRPIQADIIHEEKADVNIVDLYFRPVYAFEYKWETKGKTAVAEFDGLTGEMTSGGVTFRQQVEKMITRDLIFDVGTEAANLLIPGGGIAVRVAKSVMDSQIGDETK